MLGFLKKLFYEQSPLGSKDIAKERLRLVLLHDRASVTPQYMDLLKDDMVKAVSNYLEINEQEMQVNLNREEQTVTLVANIPVSAVKRPPATRQTEVAEDEQSAAFADDMIQSALSPNAAEAEEAAEEEAYTVHGI